MQVNKNVERRRKLYKAIKEELDRQQRTFAWLSRQTGITQATFSRMKSRGSYLSMGNLMKVSEALKKPASYFVKRIDEK